MKARRSNLIIFTIDLFLVIGSYVAAYFIRFDGPPPPRYLNLMILLLPLIVLLRAATFLYFRLDRSLWRYAGIKDLIQILKAVSVGTLLIIALGFSLRSGHPRSIFIIDWLLLVVALSGARFALRLARPLSRPRKDRGTSPRRVLIVGAGDAGEMILREMVLRDNPDYEVVGMVDDDPKKQGRRIHGIAVLGKSPQIPSLVEKHRVHEIVIAIPSVSPEGARKIIEHCIRSRARYRILPNISDLIDGTVTVRDLREVRLEDLLRREEVALDRRRIGDCLAGKTVLVTGAGGTIGSELCRQAAGFSPRRLVLFERAENPLFFIDHELGSAFPDLEKFSVVGDVCDRERVRKILGRHRPEIVFHAAAHKHVPLMESNPFEAVRNNVFGTKILAEEAVRSGVEKFILLSTDKAVDPISFMGVSKRVAELLIASLSRQNGASLIAVRFGNVLGSEGSVIPIFRRQIEKREPVTVTHPEIKRYFMTVPEAVGLVMQAGALGRGGEIFILEMGRQIKIVNLARDLIRLSGLEPDQDIEIVFTGLRPGEKMFETLVGKGERVLKTAHEKIMVLGPPASAARPLAPLLADLEAAIRKGDLVGLVAKLQEIVPTFNPGPELRRPGARWQG